MDDLEIRVIQREFPLSNRVAKQLEELILTGTLRSGQRLPSERALAERFGVSRTVIREAVQSLAARGLLETRSGDGTFFSGPTAGAVSESLGLLLRSRSEEFLVEHLHEVRKILEVAIAAQAALRATPEDISDLERILHNMEEAQDSTTWANLDVEFHRRLAAATRNPLFVILLDSIGDLLLEIRYRASRDPDAVAKAFYHHRNVFQKVRSKDPQAARQAMSAHIDQAEQTMRKAFQLDAKGDSSPPPADPGEAGRSKR